MGIAGFATLEELSAGMMAYFFDQLEQKAAMVQPLINLFCYEMTVEDLEVKHRWLGDLPDLREWLGDRHVKMLAAHGFEIVNHPYELTIGLQREELRYDKLGMIRPRILGMADKAGSFPWRQVAVALNAALTTAGYDGENFVSAGHASGSNLATGALSVDNYFAAKAQMKAQIGEDNGQALNLSPTHLFYASNIEQLAREVMIAERGSAGETNIARGDCQLVEVKELTADYWGLVDASSPVFKPLIMQHNPSFEGLAGTEGQRGLVNFVAKDSPDKSDAAYMRREYTWGIDRTMGLGYGFHQTIVMSPGS